FAIWGGAGRLGEKSQSETIAEMGRDQISMDTYYLALRNRLEALQREFRALNKSFIQQLNIPQQVLEQMIQQSLLLQKARQMGITASDSELRDRIVSLFQRDGKFIGFEEYRRILDYNRTSVAAFESELKKEIILNKFIQVLTAGITATPEAVWDYFKKQKESAKIEYLVLEESKMPSDEMITESEERAYFEKNKDKYTLPERRSGVYIFIRTDDVKKEVQITDADIEKYYQDNLDQFKEPERVRVSRIFLPLTGREKPATQAEAQGLLDRLKKGEDFSQLARTHSQDDKAKDGGDWGFDEWRRLSTDEREEVDKLSAGQVSGVVETAEGFTVLKVTEKEPSKTQTLEEVKDRVKSTLEDQKARELAAERIARLERSARREK
ncbi:MAG: SurA N-terminal domain-containing protein, partial [Acidobacteriota bacterium]